MVKSILLTKVLRIRLLASLRGDFPISKPSLYNQKKEAGTLLSIGCTAGDGLLATVNGFGFDVAACATVPMHSATLRLLSLWSAGSTPRLIVALHGLVFCALLGTEVRGRCESVGVGIQRRCVECMLPVTACDCLCLSVLLSRTCAALARCCRSHAALSVSRS